MTLKCFIEGTFDEEKKEAVMLLRVPCRTAEIAEEATRVFGEMFAECVEKAIERSGGKIVARNHTETQERSE